MSYSFNRGRSSQGLVQYNDRADLWSMNLRFGWLQAANTGLFIVYTDTRGLYDLYPTAPSAPTGGSPSSSAACSTCSGSSSQLAVQS